MPHKPARPCRYPGCPRLTDDRSGYCPDHLRQQRQQYDRERGTANERGYDARWQRYRAHYLVEHPLCVLCRDKGNIVEATVVDHIKPHRGDYKLFWDPTNHQALCAYHNRVKAAREEGAFGNRRQDE